MPGNRKELTLKEKVQVLKFLETHSERKAAEAFGISKTCENNIKMQKVEYLKRIEYENDKLCRKVRKTSNDDINKAIGSRKCSYFGSYDSRSSSPVC
jgi:hypothetical protein